MWLDAGRDTVSGIPGPSPLDMACHIGEPLISGKCESADSSPCLFLSFPLSFTTTHIVISNAALTLLLALDYFQGGPMG